MVLLCYKILNKAGRCRSSDVRRHFYGKEDFSPRVAPLRGKSCFQSSPVRRRGCLKAGHHKLIAFVQQNNLRCTCVELDCQKVLGVREAWYFRERMKKLLDNPQINVFHFEDGMRGLDSLIDFSDYIALSIPELRIIKPKTFREDTRYLTHYIKNRKPEIDIHLLGCTDVKMIAQNSFCTSADSTSWLSGVKYGWFDDGNQKAHINQFRKDLIEQRLSAVRTITEGRGLELTDKTLLYGARASLCATICKQKYTRAAGSQE